MVNIFRYEIFKLAEKATKRNISSYLDVLQDNEKLSIDELHKLQLSRLKSILQYADNHVPYYQKLFKEIGFKPSEFCKFSDLNQLPFLTKDIIKNDEKLFCKDGIIDGLVVRKTGGSTGSKLYIYYTNEALDITAAIHRRCMRWAGATIGNKEIHFSSNINNNVPLKDKLIERAKCFALNRVDVAIDVFDDTSLLNVINKVIEVKPFLIQGFPSMMYNLAKFADKNCMDVNGILNSFESTGETLYDFQREKIEGVFGCHVFNRYGNAEFGVIAHECAEHNGLHIMSDIVYVENRKWNGGAENKNEIIVTTLTNTGMPLIRYATGDLGTIDNNVCKCGLSFPRITKMEGRVHDYLPLPNGKELSTFVLLDIIDKFRGIDDFQVMLEDLCLSLFIVADNGIMLSDLQQIQALISEKHNIINLLKVNIYIVKELRTSKNGKFRYVALEYPDFEGKKLYLSNKYGDIYNCTNSEYVDTIDDFVCLDGFYAIEKSPTVNFVWGKKKGIFTVNQNKQEIEILSLTEKVRKLSVVDSETHITVELLIKKGWNFYDINLLQGHTYEFFLDECISDEEKNNDPRELGFGLRESI